MAEEVIDRDKAPQDEDKHEPKLFNQDARDAVESAYDSYAGEGEAPAILPEEPAPLEDKPVDKGMDVTASDPVSAPVEEWKPEFKDHRTAEESYRHARLKMQEALERAARLEKQIEERQYAPAEPPRMPQEPTSPPPPVLDKEAIEAEFFRDPVGFQLAMNQAMAQHAVEQAEAKITAKERDRRLQSVQASMSQKLNEHFDTKYPELKELEPMILSYGDKVKDDAIFMEPLVRSIKEAPDNMRARRIFEVSKAIIDEGVRRFRERQPEIGKALGFQVPGEPTKERLTSGAPPVVPGGTSGPTVRTEAPRPETAAEYLKERLTRQERTMSGAGRWRR